MNDAEQTADVQRRPETVYCELRKHTLMKRLFCRNQSGNNTCRELCFSAGDCLAELSFHSQHGEINVCLSTHNHNPRHHLLLYNWVTQA